MAVVTVAISQKALKHLEGSELGKLLAGAVEVEKGAYEIQIDAQIDAKLQTAKGERGGKHNQLADRLIAKVTEARTAPPVVVDDGGEASAVVERGGF